MKNRSNKKSYANKFILRFVLLAVTLIAPFAMAYPQSSTIRRPTPKYKSERKSTKNKSSKQTHSKKDFSYDNFSNNTGNENVNISKGVINNLINNMVYVEGGTFVMGATNGQGNYVSDDRKPTHVVSLSSFSICKYEVTQKEWLIVMGNNPSKFNGDDQPVENVSWNDCQTFISRLNLMTGKHFRLPTEAEWEYAARGGNLSKGYEYSGSNYLRNVAWYSDNSSGKPHNVGNNINFPNELGLYDMSGNVWEWCQDIYGSYRSYSQTNPKGATLGINRVYRGGSWNYGAGACRVSQRNSNIPTYRHNDLGFRLAM